MKLYAIDVVDRRTHATFARYERPGRTSVVIQCPFCGVTVVAYVWSLAGSGKRCPGCGALHTSGGQTLRRQGDTPPK
jgi:hypothetical protein